MNKKKCLWCKKCFFKKSNEGNPYWKTKRFCSFSCSAKYRSEVEKFVPKSCFKKGLIPWNKGKPHPHNVWNKGLTAKTSKKVSEYGRKSGNSRLNKPKRPFRIINGYRCIFLPNHPRSCKFTKTVNEQILVMERHLCRPLNSKEVVHHINGDKQDNRIENLMLFSCKGNHMRWHAKNDVNNGLYKRHKRSF